MGPLPREERKSRIPPWLERLQRGFLILAVASIVLYLLLHRGEVLELALHLDPATVLGTILLMMSLHLPIAVGFHVLQRALGVRRFLGVALSSYFARLPARYIPGGVWHTVSRYADLRSEPGMANATVGKLFLAETVLVATNGLLVAGTIGTMTFASATPAAVLCRCMLMAGIVIATVVLVGVWRWRGSAIVLRILLAALAQSVAWIGVGLAFAHFAKGYSDGEFAQCRASDLAATYVTSASLGYIAIFAPQGWGVTEGVFTMIRTCPVPMPMVVATLFGLRITSLIADLLAFATWYAAAKTEIIQSTIRQGTRPGVTARGKSPE